MSIVIDASVALKWVLDEPGQEAADVLLDQELIAPGLWLVEAANALWRRSQRGELSAEEAAERLRELGSAPVATMAIEADVPMAIQLASAIGHPVHDCLYLALALRENTHVITADARFHAVVQRSPDLKDAVRLLGS